MEAQGWIRLHRRLLDWEWFTEPKTLQLFVYCLLRANYKPNKWRGIDINRGQFITILENLASETGLSVQEVRTSLKRLVNTSVITDKATNKYRIITVCNYDSYQPADWTDQQTKEQTAQQTVNNQITHEQQTVNNQITTDNKDNNINKDNNSTHTQESINFFPSHVSTCERTHEKQLMDWLAESVPTVQQMSEPLNEQQASWLVRKLAVADIKRIFLAIHNKDGTKNKSAYATFCSYASNDTILKERRSCAGKLYTYDELTNIVHGGGKLSDFTMKVINGSKLWVKITDE